MVQNSGACHTLEVRAMSVSFCLYSVLFLCNSSFLKCIVVVLSENKNSESLFLQPTQQSLVGAFEPAKLQPVPGLWPVVTGQELKSSKVV